MKSKPRNKVKRIIVTRSKVEYIEIHVPLETDEQDISDKAYNGDYDKLGWKVEPGSIEYEVQEP